MDDTKALVLAVSDFIALTNQNLEYAFRGVAVEGEVAGFKVNQNKYVFFDLKDDNGSIGCFMMVWQLRQPIEDGMKVVVTATPKLTAKGKFSLTVRAIRPSGEGNLKRSFAILKDTLQKEGLFDLERKRPLPAVPRMIAVISSTEAAGYADFMKILDDRWGGVDVAVAHVQVQGKEAPDQLIRALRYFNTQKVPPEVIVIIRGGGSLDDLSAFNDELLVREIAASRVPTLVGVGHETDTTLADLAADVRAATPSNAAQLVVPDKHEIVRQLHRQLESTVVALVRTADRDSERIRARLDGALRSLVRRHESYVRQLDTKRQVLSELDPQKVLARGYAVVRGTMRPGERIEIETHATIATAEVYDVTSKS